MPGDDTIPEMVDFFSTREYYTQGALTRDPNKFGVQGAFLVLRPSQTTFDDMLQLLICTEYTFDKGWDKQMYILVRWVVSRCLGF
jgi:hypothetical protein